jgi:hypothetical protein
VTENPASPSTPPNHLELHVNGTRLVSLTFGITLYTDQPLSRIPDAVLKLWALFQELVPPSDLKFYATENMSVHKPVKKATLNLLQTWLSAAAPLREYIVLEMKGGDVFNAAPDTKFQVWGDEQKAKFFGCNNAKLVSMAFPAAWGFDKPAEMKTLFLRACQDFPFNSGQAGFQFEYSRYAAVVSETHAWKTSMRHRGIDISYPVNDKIAVGFDGIKGVNWLTGVSDKLLKDVGGRDVSLPAGVSMIPLKSGVVFQAGDAPRPGDRNRKDFLPEYMAVYGLLKPLIERAIARSKAFELEDRDRFEEKSKEWMRRLMK